MHNTLLQNFNLDACYGKTLLKDGTKIIDKFNSLKLSGANVTVPHKEYAFKLCDKVKGIASDIKAVNTLVKDGNKVYGYNTDAIGFYESIASFKNVENVLILGAGGTAKAIAFILRKNGMEVTILNRSAKRLEFFQKSGFKVASWDNFKADKFDLIINTTTAGLKESIFPLKESLLSSLMQNSSYAFDVIYGKETPFLELAKKSSLICKDGSDMLLYQAVFAFNLFYNNRFKTEDIEKEMRKAFNLAYI